MSSRRRAEDEQLLAQIGGGSADALGELYDRFSTPARRLAQSVCRDDGHAEEAVQDAFLSVWRNGASYRPGRGAVGPWLLVIVRRKAIDVIRRESPRAAGRVDQGKSDTIPDGAPDLVDEVAGDAEARHLRVLLARLPLAQAEVIALAYYGQLSHDEIAKHLGVPAGTVKGRMRLGLAKLREHLAWRELG